MAGCMVLQRQARNIGALRGQQVGQIQSRDYRSHIEQSLHSPAGFLVGGTPQDGYFHRCPGHRGNVLLYCVRLLVSRPAAPPVAYPFDMILWEAFDFRIVGDGGGGGGGPFSLQSSTALLIGPQCALYIPQRTSLWLGLTTTTLMGLAGDFLFFALANFAAAAPMMMVAPVAVPMGGTMAVVRFPLITAQDWSPADALVPTAPATTAAMAAACSACVMFRCRSLMAASVLGPGGSRL